MAIESIQVNTTTPQPLRRMSSFMSNRKEISYGHINVKKETASGKSAKPYPKDKILAAIGAITGVSIVLAAIMKRQKSKILSKSNIL